MQNTESTVTLILAIGSIVCPLLFGYCLWRMSQVFVSKEEFATYKASVEKEQVTINQKLENIDKNTIELLQRTAHLRNAEH